MFDRWQKTINDLQELGTILSTGDEEMQELAKEEYEEMTDQIKALEKDIIIQLAPKDAADETSAILEIRAGAGGDEASIFSADMARMYERFAQLQRWKWEVLACSEETGSKGFKVNGSFVVNKLYIHVFLGYYSQCWRQERIWIVEI